MGSDARIDQVEGRVPIAVYLVSDHRRDVQNMIHSH